MDQFIEPKLTDVRLCWEEIRGPICSILNGIPHCEVIPEDIYSECVNGRAQLYMSSIGFMVLTIEVDPFSKTTGIPLFCTSNTLSFAKAMELTGPWAASAGLRGFPRLFTIFLAFHPIRSYLSIYPYTLIFLNQKPGCL